jgi:hypothetical protein
MGKYLLGMLCVSAGMFVASTGLDHFQKSPCLFAAYLPSSFAMYGVALAHAFSLQPPSKRRTVLMFTILGVTTILSWPFAAALAIVLFFDELLQPHWDSNLIPRLGNGLAGAFVIVLTFLVSSITFSSQYRSF